ncbi:MAG: hypothetical protein J6S62_00120, partial [Bacteroidales bacterium]|nr:hypothetical protein [Bacteroidales bacterium]
MKRVFTIIAAGLLTFFAASCVNEKQAIFDDALATPPVLGSYDIGEDAVTASYTPGAFNTSFNTSIAPKHSFAIVKLNGEDVSRTIASSEKDGKLTVKLVNLIRAGIALGAQEGSSASMELAIRASMQDPARDNGVNGFVDSEAHITIPSLEMIIPEIVGSPYEEYVEASAWTLIGAISEYGISWDGDLNMWTDGAGNHVAAHVKLKAGDEVKFRKDQKWDENYGGDFSTLGEEFKVSQDGPNIKITADGIYDLFLYESGQTAMVSEAYDPYPDFVYASDWSVIGALPAHGISWDGDIAMVTDGTTHVAFSVQIGAADEFKFRQGRDWAVNLGGEFGGLDNDFPVTQDGPNIIVGAAGVYDLFVVPGDGTAKVTAASGVRVSGKVSNDTPEPPAPSGWGIIGDFNGWGGDVAMTEDAGVWTGFFTNADKEDGSHGAFKVRKDADWAENYGAPGDEEPVEVTLGEAMPVVAGGKNFSSPAGLYKVVLNLTDESNPTLTVSAGDVYSLIGQINGTSWDTDFELTEADGVY